MGLEFRGRGLNSLACAEFLCGLRWACLFSAEPGVGLSPSVASGPFLCMWLMKVDLIGCPARPPLEAMVP